MDMEMLGDQQHNNLTSVTNLPCRIMYNGTRIAKKMHPRVNARLLETSCGADDCGASCRTHAFLSQLNYRKMLVRL